MSSVNFQCLSETPDSPDSGRVKLYADSNCALFIVSSDGSVTPASGQGSSKTVDEDYAVQPEDYVLRVTGNRTITLPATRSNEITVYAATGSVTLSETPENQPNPITIGNSYTLIYDETLGGYFVK